MIYAMVNMKEVIARVVRNTRVQDASFILAMDEWIPEALGIMDLKQATTPHWQDTRIHFHKQKLPCDCKEVMAIEYQGRNLLPSNSLRVVSAVPNQNASKMVNSKQNTFISNPQTYNFQHGNGEVGTIYDSSAIPTFFAPDASACHRLPGCEGHWYQIDGGVITTSFKTGDIRIHYRRIAVDEGGLPLIPDNENLKQALYWYTLGMMIGAGFDSKIFSFDKIMGPHGYFETAAGRAITEITFPTDGELELAVRNLNKMIKDENYFDRFFETPDQHHGHQHEAEISYTDAARVVPNQTVDASTFSLTSKAMIVGEIPVGLINGVNLFYTTSRNYNPTTFELFLNGLEQTRGVHYTLNNLSGIFFVDAPQATPAPADVITVNYTPI